MLGGWGNVGRQDAPKSAPTAAKRAPRAAKRGPRAAKTAPRATQKPPREPQEPPRRPQDAPRATKRPSRSLQEPFWLDFRASGDHFRRFLAFPSISGKHERRARPNGKTSARSARARAKGKTSARSARARVSHENRLNLPPGLPDQGDLDKFAARPPDYGKTLGIYLSTTRSRNTREIYRGTTRPRKM